MKEHKSLADSPDYGNSLTGVQNLQKKHQVVRQRAVHMNVMSCVSNCMYIHVRAYETLDNNKYMYCWF